MSNTKIRRPSTDKIAIMIQRELMSATFAYGTVKSTPSSMDDSSTHVMENR